MRSIIPGRQRRSALTIASVRARFRVSPSPSVSSYRGETPCMQTSNPLDALKIERGLLERQTAAGYVADSLRAAIQTGALSDGMELNQVALAEHFGISRVPVREALRALEGEGWITATPHRRSVVQAVSPERIQETFEVRALLETHLIEKVIARISDEQIAKLKKA